MAGGERPGIRRILRYVGIATIIIGIILLLVLSYSPYVVKRSETLTLEENQSIIIVEVRYSGQAEQLTVTISVDSPAWPGWYSLALHNQSQVDHYRAFGEFQDGLFGHTINQTATYDADIDGQGTCYLVFGRGNTNDSVVISADVSYKVTGTNPYYVVPGIVTLAAGAVLVGVGSIGMRIVPHGPSPRD